MPETGSYSNHDVQADNGFFVLFQRFGVSDGNRGEDGRARMFFSGTRGIRSVMFFLVWGVLRKEGRQKPSQAVSEGLDTP